MLPVWPPRLDADRGHVLAKLDCREPLPELGDLIHDVDRLRLPVRRFLGREEDAERGVYGDRERGAGEDHRGAEQKVHPEKRARRQGAGNDVGAL